MTAPEPPAEPDGVSPSSGEPYGPGTVVDVIAEEIHETVGMKVSWPRICGIAHRAAARLRREGLLAPSGDTGQAREPVITFDDEVVWLGRRYVAALNAVLCAPPGSNDVDRWRGHAEAFRQVAEQICRDLNRPAPPFGREEWRAANGIYSEEYLAELREIVRRSAGPSADTAQAPDVAALLARCDAEDWSAGEFGWIQTTEIRALLGTDTTPEARQ